MKKYLVVELGGRGVVESVSEVEGIKEFRKKKREFVVEGMKEDKISSEEIRSYIEEWVMSEKYNWGYDLCFGEEWSFMCFDMKSDVYKKWYEKLEEEMGGVESFWNWESVSDDRIYDLINDGFEN